MTFAPTDEQLALIDATSGSHSIMADALAGCAKTTTLVLMAQRVKVPALALVFNKKNQLEMAGKFPGNFKTQTMNGLGFGAWMRANPQVNKWDVDGRKLGSIISQLAKDRKIDLSSDQWDFTRRLVSMAMLNGLVPGDQGEPLVADTREVWAAMADELLMTDDDFALVADLTHHALEESIRQGQSGRISFDDQVYLPTVLGGRFPSYPFIATDESQDLNALNHQMVGKALRGDGRLTVVGDPKQSIYGFRGAVTDSMGKMLELRPHWTRLPLATTFRCPKVVVERQRGHAPGFTAWHTNAEGRFARLPDPGKVLGEGEEYGWGFAEFQAMKPSPEGSCAILCRNNGPLLSLAFKLLRSGIGVNMLGRDIGKGLIALSRKLCPEDDTPRDTCVGLVDDWCDGEASLARANGHEEKVAGITDRAECLQAALANAGVADARGMRRALGLLFARDSGLVDLGSIHRAKGAEWDLVGLLDPWRIPSKWAREALAAGDPRQMEQEKNLLYVAETRTKHTLVYLNLEDFHS